MPEASGEAEWPDVLGCAPVVCIFSYIFITGARMLIRGCHAPVLDARGRQKRVTGRGPTASGG